MSYKFKYIPYNFLEEFIKIIGSNLHIFYLYINYTFMIFNSSPNRYISLILLILIFKQQTINSLNL